MKKTEKYQQVVKLILDGWRLTQISKSYNINKNYITKVVQDLLNNSPDIKSCCRCNRKMQIKDLIYSRRHFYCGEVCLKEWRDARFQQGSAYREKMFRIKKVLKNGGVETVKIGIQDPITKQFIEIKTKHDFIAYARAKFDLRSWDEAVLRSKGSRWKKPSAWLSLRNKGREDSLRKGSPPEGQNEDV